MSCLLLGFDRAEVSGARDDVLDENYQTDLPEFTDAEPESPLDFLDPSAGDSESCDPAEDPDCEASSDGERREDSDGDGERGDKRGEGDGTSSSNADDAEPSDGQNARTSRENDSESSAARSFWDHESRPEPTDPSEPPDIDLPEGLLTVLQILGITILVVVVLLIGWRIALALSNRSETAEHVDDDAPTSPAGALRSNAPTRPHGELAEQEHFDEAIHRLLLEVIDVLAERQSGLTSPSLTARELLRRVRLDDESHRHLAALVRAVEEILFARRTADAQKYQSSLDHFREIMQALGRGSA